MTLGPFLFMAPLALLGLLSLPVIWYILRATPPAPKQAALPSLRLLDNIEDRQETPARTPWWLWLLRLVAASAAIIGLSLPIYAPGAKPPASNEGAVLVVIDDGWTSAQRMSDLRKAAVSALDGSGRNTSAHILLTAPRILPQDPSEALRRAAFEARIRSIRAQAWGVDRPDALERLIESGLQPARILWLTNGLEPETARPFATALAGIAPLSIYAATPRGPMAITALNARASGIDLTLRRASSGPTSSHFVTALTLDDAALATTEAVFEAGSKETKAVFDLPPAALSRIARFKTTGTSSAGNVWLWDSANRSRRIGLVSGDNTSQPLLSDMHYVRKALEPYATITEGNLGDLISDNPDAIIMTDIGQIDANALTAVTAWIEDGGALIRFAGPRMAAQGDDLVPAPLRRASREIGGALTWEDPQPLGPFPQASPFAGLVTPTDIFVRQQVLARPGPELSRRTWARLADGSPLVTADRRGNGMIILFHVTAGPDWSDLPYAGVFVEMLRRAIAAGQGETIADEDGLYSPTLSLTATGRLTQPGSNATPLQSNEFSDIKPSERHPPGLYQGPAGIRALNTAKDYTPVTVNDWPSNAVLLGDAEAKTLRLGGPLIALAGLILAIDLIIALALAGRLPRLGRAAQSGLVLGLASLAVLSPPPAEAQFGRGPVADIDSLDKASQAALDLRLAYIETGDSAADRTTLAGLEGLSLTLFRRSSVEPAEPHAVNLESDALDVYPILFLSLPQNPEPFSPNAISRLNAYMRSGGALFIDTRTGGDLSRADSFQGLTEAMPGLDTPALSPVSDNHVLTRSFYLLKGFPGRYSGRQLWIEATGASNLEQRRGDGVSRLFVGDADYLAAWAIDERGRPTYTVDGGEQQREMATRFGVNLVIYVLTGNYKEDQVHIPALLQRLGDEDEDSEPTLDGLPVLPSEVE